MLFIVQASEQSYSDNTLAAVSQALNDHINVEFTASYAYHALFAYFDRDTVGLRGFAKYFKKQSDEVLHTHTYPQTFCSCYLSRRQRAPMPLGRPFRLFCLFLELHVERRGRVCMCERGKGARVGERGGK